MTSAELATLLREKIEATKAHKNRRQLHPSEPAWHRAFGRLSAYNEILEIVAASPLPPSHSVDK